jgi:hypothetical protein
MTREELFYRANTLFGPDSQITNSLRTPGTFKKQDDVEDIFGMVGTCVRNKEEEFKDYRAQCRVFIDQMRKAYINEELNI